MASGVVDQGVDQDRLAHGLLEKLLAEQGLRRDDAGRGRGHRIRPETRPHGRRHGDGDHLPGPGRPPPRARRPDDHRHRRPGQQARSPEGRRRGGRLRHERPLRGRHGAFPGNAGRPARHPLPQLGSLVGRSRAPAVISSMCVVFAESEIVGSWRRACAGGHCRRRRDGDRHADYRHDRPQPLGAHPLHRRRRPGARHGRGAPVRVGPARADRPPAPIDLRLGAAPSGRRSAKVTGTLRVACQNVVLR